MPNIGPFEIAIVLIIALIVFGPKRLPELGRSLGKGLNEFKDGMANIGNSHDDDEDEDDEVIENTPAELVPPAAGLEPDVTEITSEENRGETGKPEAAEPVESEVVPERQD